MSVVVVGGGVLGFMHALEARRRGHPVTHLEREAGSRGASVRNFGLIWVSGRAGARSWTWPAGPGPRGGQPGVQRGGLHHLQPDPAGRRLAVRGQVRARDPGVRRAGAEHDQVGVVPGAGMVADGVRRHLDGLTARQPLRRPSRITPTRSAMDSASSWSWVTNRVVVPSRCCRERICSRSCRRTLASSAERGSSRSRTRGSMASARASATRCCWPPDSWCGYCRREQLVPQAPGHSRNTVPCPAGHGT
jgi:hypothetical protein